MHIEFYDKDLAFPISGIDTYNFDTRYLRSRVLKALLPFFEKKTNILVDLECKDKPLISNFIAFCKAEGVDYKSILQIELILKGDIFKMIVNRGENKDVKLFTID